MKIMNSTLITLEPVFNQMANQHLPVRTLYKLSKLSKTVSEEMEFYRDKMRSIIMEYAEKDEDGNPTQENGNVKIVPEKITDCNNEIGELLALEIELPDIVFSLDELEKLDLSLEDFNKLLPFIDE